MDYELGSLCPGTTQQCLASCVQVSPWSQAIIAGFSKKYSEMLRRKLSIGNAQFFRRQNERNLQTNAGSRGSVRIRRTLLFRADPDTISKFEISAFSLAKPINQLTFLSETTVAKHDSLSLSDASPLSYDGRQDDCSVAVAVLVMFREFKMNSEFFLGLGFTGAFAALVKVSNVLHFEIVLALLLCSAIDCWLLSLPMRIIGSFSDCTVLVASIGSPRRPPRKPPDKTFSHSN